MGIIYLISTLIILISFILVKKTDKELNIISFICIGIVTLFCYNAFVCYILTFFTIPLKLWLLSIINIAVSAIFIFKMVNKKKIQKFVFNKIDLIYVIIIAIMVIIVSYFNFNFPFNVNYETGDPSVHYLTSIKFAESEALLANSTEDQAYGNLSMRKTVSYVNSGLLMKSLTNNLNARECYNIFVVFGMITLYLTGATLYSAMSNISCKKEHKLWAFAISTICMLGYPLNSFLFGFEYLSMGLLVISAIIAIVSYYKSNILTNKYFIGIMALLNYGLFASYYMFVPFMYPALWIYFCIDNYNKTKKIITKELCHLLFVTLLVPFILGFIYHIAPQIYGVIIEKNINFRNAIESSSYIAGDGLAVNGYIYVNFYSNIILLLPLTIYLFIKDVKDNKLKDNMYLAILVFLAIAFIEILIIGNKYGKVSTYYLSKNYYALWIVLAYCNFKAMLLLAKKNSLLPRILIGIYIVLMILCTIFTKVKVEYVLKNVEENIFSVMEVFGANKTIIFDKPIDFNQDEIDILMYARKNLDFTKKIEVVADEQPNYWAYVWLRYVNDEELSEDYFGQNKLNVKRHLLKKNINNVDYVIFFKKSKEYQTYKDKLFDNSEIIYENSAGGILKYKN